MRIAGSTLLTMLAAGIVSVTGCSSSSQDESAKPADNADIEAARPATPMTSRAAAPPTTKPQPVHGAAAASLTGQASSMSISYQGGPVMLGTPDVYFIWYGDWTGSPALTILPDFISNLSGSPYLKINSTYTDSQGRAVTGDVHYAGSTTDAYSRGKSLSQQDVEEVVARALSNGSLPTSSNAIYFVLTSIDVKMSNFCNQFCGWHINGSGGSLSTSIKFAFIGNAAQCPQSCAPYSPSPNGDLATDAMVSMIAHELEESLTDPDLDAWVDPGNQENGDKCAWQFGTTYTTANGAMANMRLGSRDYLVQTNFDRHTNKCELALPAPSTLAVTILSPAPSTVLHAGGPLDIVAQATDDATVTSAVVHWTSSGSTTDFTMTKNAAGDWELSTTLSSTAKAGSRTFTVTATDDTGHQVTTAPVTLDVQ
jgi:hypothetical protein